ncbi:MAG: hypothetical protein LWY06_15680 [Firmicutes bacterium]|nr:hypothetical protein [Bacillota bacterium]
MDNGGESVHSTLVRDEAVIRLYERIFSLVNGLFITVPLMFYIITLKLPFRTEVFFPVLPRQQG